MTTKLPNSTAVTSVISRTKKAILTLCAVALACLTCLQAKATPYGNYDYMSFQNQDLSGQDFTGASCNFTDFSNTTGVSVNFTGASLVGAGFYSANFQNANFSSSQCGTAVFSNTPLTGANFANADLSGTQISGSDLTGVQSGGITTTNGGPVSLPSGYALINGYIVGPGVNLTGANLAGANLSNVNLSNADLSGANLTNANFTGANLSHAIVTNAVLTAATFSSADLTGVDFRGVDCSGIDFDSASLSGANFNGVNLTGANLTSANFYYGPDYGADLRNANLTSANLSGANLTQCSLDGANLTYASLISTALDYARLIGADLTGAGLSGDSYAVDLSYATLYHTDFDYCNLSGSFFQHANFAGAIFGTASLDGNFDGVRSGGTVGYPNLSSGWSLINGYIVGPGAILTGANLAGANLSYFDLSNADLSGADLSNAVLTGVNLSDTKFDDLTILTGVQSSGIIGTPTALPTGWFLINGALFNTTQITLQPQSQTINAGSTLSLGVVAIIGNLTYQWQHNGSNILNATDSALSIPNVVRANGGSYTVIVTGVGTVTSDAAVIKVIDPLFTTQPTSFSGAVGTSHTFSAVAIGTSLHYQWYFQNNAATTELARQTNSTLTIAPITAASAGTYFCVVINPVTDIPGENVIVSQPATLTAYLKPTVAGPANVTKTAGNNATFTAIAGPVAGGPFTYQWSLAGVGNLADNGHIVGANSAHLNIINIQSADAGTYQCTIANAYSATATTLITHGVLKVLPDTASPVSMILHPTGNTRYTNGLAVNGQANIAPELDIDGRAIDTGLITDVTLTRTVPAGYSQSLTLTHSTPGRVVWTNHVTLVDGTNTFVATATDSAGHQTTSIARTYYLITPATLTVNSTGNYGTSKILGTPSLFGTPANSATLDIGIGYNIKTAPQSGKTFVNWTDGNSTVLGTSTTLHFIMSNGLILNANYAP